MNLLQKEETAQSIPELIQKSMGQQGQQEEEKGLVDKAKGTLKGQ